MDYFSSVNSFSIKYLFCSLKSSFYRYNFLFIDLSYSSYFCERMSFLYSLTIADFNNLFYSSTCFKFPLRFSWHFYSIINTFPCSSSRISATIERLLSNYSNNDYILDVVYWGKLLLRIWMLFFRSICACW